MWSSGLQQKLGKEVVSEPVRLQPGKPQAAAGEDPVFGFSGAWSLVLGKSKKKAPGKNCTSEKQDLGSVISQAQFRSQSVKPPQPARAPRIVIAAGLSAAACRLEKRAAFFGDTVT